MDMHKDHYVSIIIPAYNAESTIYSCLQSVMKQTHPYLQIIIINDGSTDQTLHICKQLAEKDDRIILINSENKGPAHARNLGLDKASSPFIQFVDADDKVSSRMTEALLKSFQNQTDLAMCGYIVRTNKSDTAVTPQDTGTFSLTLFLKKSGRFYRDHLLQSPCNKLYRRKIINSYTLIFPEDLTIGEDLAFNLKYLEKCRTISIMKKPLYIYITRNNSLSRQVNEDYFYQQNTLITQFKTLLQAYDQYNSDNEAAIKDIFSQVIINTLSQVYKKHHNKEKTLDELSILFTQKDIKKHLPYFNKNWQALVLKYCITFNLKRTTYYLLKVKDHLSATQGVLYRILKRLLKG